MKRILALAFALIAGPALAGSLTWTAPTTYTNGEPLVVKEYRIYEGNLVIKSVPAPVVPAPVISVSIVRKPLTNYTVTALDAIGAESDHSNAATTGPFTPGKPFGCRWQ